MNVKELMKRNPVTFNKDTKIKEALSVSGQKGIYDVPVIGAQNKVVGFFCRGEVAALKDKKISLDSSVEKTMNTNFIVINEDDDANVIVDLPSEFFAVVNKDQDLVGVVRKSYVIEKLKFANIQLNAVLNNTNNAIVIVDLNKNIRVCNDIFKNLLKIDAKRDIAGENIFEIVPLSTMLDLLISEDQLVKKTITFNGKRIIATKYPAHYKEEIVGATIILQDVTDYIRNREELLIEKNEVEVLSTIIDSAYDGCVVIDSEGYITMISDEHKKFFGVEGQDVIGKHVADVVENTRLHIVAKTGVAEIAELQEINGRNAVTSRIPIFRDGKVVNVVGKILFRDTGELDDFYSKISKMEEKIDNYKDELNKVNSSKYSFESIRGSSQPLENAKGMARKVSATDSTVLITGDSGTGKELFAHAIHRESQRRMEPFVKVNCAAIPHELLESELFGYESGAFTGAKTSGKLGKFEVAEGGTIFLDEIGDMPLSMQAKLLRVLQEKEIERIGSNEPKNIDVRVITATNRNLSEMIEKKQFRLDLYYRLNVVTIEVPTLEERKEDIVNLASLFIQKYQTKYLKKVKGISESAMSSLIEYNWPGNVRELENIIERAINLVENNGEISRKHLPFNIESKSDVDITRKLKSIMCESERKVIKGYLEAVNYNKSKAANLLGISRTALYEKIEKFNIKDNKKP